jgi:hypothetical protein
MSCQGTVTAAQAVAAAGMSVGTGLAPAAALNNATAAVAATAPIAAAQAATAAAQQGVLDGSISSSALNAVSTMGADIAPGLSGVIPGDAQALLGTGQLTDAIRGHAAEIMGGGDLSGFAQNFGAVSGIAQMGSTFMGAITGAAAGLGNALGSVVDIATSGLNKLGDLPSLSGDLGSLGKFGDLANTGASGLMSAGSVAGQLLNNGLGGVGQLSSSLGNLGISGAAALGSFANQGAIQGVLDKVSGTNLDTMQNLMGSSVPGITNLGQLTDITKALPNSVGSLPAGVTDFGGFSKELNGIGNFRNVSTLGNLGGMMSNVELPQNFTHIVEPGSLVSSLDVDIMSDTITGGFPGSGPNGSLTVKDMIGTAAGYVHDQTLPNVATGINQLQDLGSTQRLTELYGHITSTVQGQYGTGSEVHVPGVGSFTDRSSAVIGITQAVESEMTNIMTTSDTRVLAAATMVDENHRASANQVMIEKKRLMANGVDLAGFSPMNTSSIMSFAQQLPQHGVSQFDTGDYIERCATDDRYGEAIRLSMIEGRNQQVFANYGLNLNNYI